MSCKATSWLKRASLTCELAGFGAAAEVDRDLLEWNYGNYDGRTSGDIHAERPDWLLFRDGNLARSIRMTATAMGRNVTPPWVEKPRLSPARELAGESILT